MEKFQINIVKIEYPKRKKDRKGKTIEDFVADILRKNKYIVLFSRRSKKYLKGELDSPSFFQDFPDFFKENIWYSIPLGDNKLASFPDLENGKMVLKKSIKSGENPKMWVEGKQITQSQLKKGIEESERNLKLSILKRKALNKEYKKKYLKIKSKFPREFQKLKKINFGSGKPDLFVFNNKEFFFCEVKSHNDSWSRNQVEWFLRYRAFPYRLYFA